MMKRITPLAVLALAPFALNAEILLLETFDYANGRLVDVSGGAWSVHSGTRALNVVNSAALIEQPDIAGGGEDVNRLMSAGFDPATDNTTKLYAAFSVNFSVLPVDVGSYFAHFRSTAGSEFYARLGASTEGAAAGTFRLSLANESWSPASTVEYPMDLSLGVSYDVVVRLDLASDQSTLWVNPMDESSTSVTAVDTIGYSAGTINSYALRQGTSTSGTTGSPGTQTVDSLRVGTSFADIQAVPEPSTFALLGLGAAGLLLRRRQ